MLKTCPSVLLLALALSAGAARADRDVLWKIVDGQCVPAAAASAALPPPCTHVNRGEGWATLKDRRGALQYLLLPTAKIAGLESPELLRADTPNFIARSWDERVLLDRLRGRPLPREAVSLTVNPARRRSQDQLHVHISCTRPELLARLADVQDELTTRWAPLRGGWLGHEWYVRRVDGDTLDGLNPVADVAAQVPGAADEMDRVGISVVAMNFRDGGPGFVLMATRWTPDDVTSGSAEHDVQDHDCTILRDAG